MSEFNRYAEFIKKMLLTQIAQKKCTIQSSYNEIKNKISFRSSYLETVLYKVISNYSLGKLLESKTLILMSSKSIRSKIVSQENLNTDQLFTLTIYP